ncbi:sugar ABC transporter permease [Listeria monocytogenes]|jgi:maltooligosaccharide ABC transporter membrane protein|uniref:Lmo2123 protein n=13 Tax=Listeria TaxID=1637 RepID=Q8Y5E1_LISMO|nr:MULTISPECIES: sugar ABC transporter permease [Listeria]NP_465647.1 sugar ABC transporter permease [Listeria monocytogenes EGD-e]EAA0166332.1 sugar ABC transporter permease [Listeria monocytogenes serotype 1/2a]EAD3235496.1 sugar ABC transporter permease [Listeria monocytogenes CFSAN002202]EAE1680446.1 sugar ABC transporter permease [Listeria monocytogenes LIS0071]EAE3701901.1 sugar ABC transporter permease [Listeria monocytogenes serotype 1/2c]EAE3705914.1 sugar ABC transporter permease [L
MRDFMKDQRTTKFLTQFFTYLFLTVLTIIILYPILITASSAFKPGNIAAFTLEWSDSWTLNNFTRLFNETLYLDWYKNTLIIAVVTMIMQVTIVTLAGYTYSRYRFKGRKNSLIFFLIIQMVPTMAALTAFYVLAMLLGALDQYWFLTLIYIGGGIPMNTWLMKGYFDTVPRDLDESAKLDGAGHFRIFAQIILPLVRPMIAVQALWAFMGPFGDFLLAKFLLRTPENLTIAVGLQTFIANPQQQKVALFAAGAILAALPICLLFFFLQKNFVSGLTAGGTKG